MFYFCMGSPYYSTCPFWKSLCSIYGGIFILFSILWEIVVDKKRSDRYEVIGSFVAVFGAIIIFYAPR